MVALSGHQLSRIRVHRACAACRSAVPTFAALGNPTFPRRLAVLRTWVRRHPTGYCWPVADSPQPLFGSREKRIAYNEDWCRDVNERKAESMKSGDPVAGFRCECWHANCAERIPLSGREWQEVRARPNRFAVAPGHVAVELEAVVEEYPHFWLIEKHGEAGDVAEKLA